ncbi:mechanosensitive ion channel family protein [Butyrivibrio sp. YAB3001]|uniref:mechanosensitive ion channel family protein n=1 Tax=Butyrivibrio sp. YAB3001 TaxID=1520812 RepID=UPI0008F68CDC|nr:mechanosensitive ion channel family protein [Butyrivibrio sp. YAB3001]SFB70377.1 small conductance mechanosensitive channel [Butyrivibrio sp. YAB3001]
MFNSLLLTNLASSAEETIETFAEAVNVENLNPGAFEKFFKELPDKLVPLLFKAAVAIVILVVMWQVIRLISNIIEKSLEKTKLETATSKFLAKLVKVGLEIVLLFTIAAAFGMDTASIVALLGSAGVAIGLAVQGTLSNFAGGILILIAKPFRAGDYIVVNGSGIEGTVVEIALINSKLLTGDGRKVIVPNGNLASTIITNNTGNTMRILDTMVGISYGADIDKAREVALKVLDGNAYISDKYDKKVFVDELGDSSVVLRVRGWVKPSEYLLAKWSMNEEIKKAFDKEGVEIPFPQVDVHMKN